MAATTPSRGLVKSEGDAQDIIAAMRAIGASLQQPEIGDSSSVQDLVASLEDGSILLRAARRLAGLSGIALPSDQKAVKTPNKVPSARNFVQ